MNVLKLSSCLAPKRLFYGRTIISKRVKLSMQSSLQLGDEQVFSQLLSKSSDTQFLFVGGKGMKIIEYMKI